MRKKFVMLTAAEDEAADKVGVGRYNAHQRYGRNPESRHRKSYDMKRMVEPFWWSNSLAARCELAVAKFYGAEWIGDVWSVEEHKFHAEDPDVRLGKVEIEVRRRRTGKWGVPVDEKDARNNRLMVWAGITPATETTLTTVTIWGEGSAAEMWEVGSLDRNGDTLRRYADPKFLKEAGTILTSAFAPN